jgi:hypothetical protein
MCPVYFSEFLNTESFMGQSCLLCAQPSLCPKLGFSVGVYSHSQTIQFSMHQILASQPTLICYALYSRHGCAIAQAVSRWLLTAAARVQAWVWSGRICGGQSGALGQVFSEYFGFPCQSSFYQILHHHPSPGAGTIGHSVADVLSGPSLDSTTHYANYSRHSVHPGPSTG